MALSVSQIAAVSYPAVLAEMRKPANQWVENSALRLIEKKGALERISFGENIEVPLDYRANPDGGVLAADQDQFALTKTEVITSAVYEIAQVSYPVTWTKGDEVKNPTENQKIALVRSLLENGINSHDDLLEQLIFTTSAAGGTEVNGLDTLVPTSGQGTVGGIAATTETFWRNYADTYLADGSDIEATFTVAYNEALKGSGSTLGPTFMLSGSDPHMLYESGLQALQRFSNTSEADGAFKTLKFKTLDYAFSQYGSDEVYFLNPKSYKLLVSKQFFRDKQQTEPVPGQNASYFLIYSALQAVTNNKSRLAVVYSA
jgi:hypothetical protein